MARILAYVCTNDSLTPHVMTTISNEISEQADGPSAGVGLGWVQNQRTLLRTNPRPSASAPALTSLMADIQSRTMIGYARSGADDSSATNEHQPFRFRQWLFAHEGQELPTDAILEKCPEFIRGNIKGSSASEAYFHAFLAELLREDLLDQAPLDRQRVAKALGASVAALARSSELSDYRAVTVSAKTIIGANLAGELSFKVIRGLSVSPEPAFAGHRPRVVANEAFRAVLITNEFVEGWDRVPERSVVWFDDEWNPSFEPID